MFTSARNYDPVRAGVAADLTILRGPVDPVLARIDPLLATPIALTETESHWLFDFVREGLLDARAKPEHFRKLVPEKVPSSRPALLFQFDGRPGTE